MATGTVEFYDVVAFVHIAAVVLAFGPTFGYAVFQTIAERDDPRSIPTIMRSFSVIDRFVGTPAAIVLIAAGIYLTVDRHDFGDFFVSFGLAVIIILLALLHAFFVPAERKLAELAERDIAAAGDGEVALSEEYRKLSKRAALVGTLSSLTVIVTIYVMTAKPFM